MEYFEICLVNLNGRNKIRGGVYGRPTPVKNMFWFLIDYNMKPIANVNAQVIAATRTA